jgi:hypothetical protein
MTAPVASGWSGRRVGLAPTGKAPPFHGAHPEETVERCAFGGQLKIIAAIEASAVVARRPDGRAFRRVDGRAASRSRDADTVPKVEQTE